MAIQTVDTPYTGKYGHKPRTPKSNLGKDDFLKLLTEQLKNQDPLKPMDDMSFVTQMSSFSSLEQMTNMNKSLEQFLSKTSSSTQMDAVSFLGKTISAQKKGMLSPVTGKVESISFKDGVPYLKVGDNSFKVSDVKTVTPTITT